MKIRALLRPLCRLLGHNRVVVVALDMRAVAAGGLQGRALEASRCLRCGITP